MPGDGGTIALIRRRDADGVWLFPKDCIEPGERAEVVVEREIHEEAGLAELELFGDMGTYTRPGINSDDTPRD